VLFAAFVRIRLLSMPLERDEGEFAYIGQLILQHIPPYTLAYTMKLPGTSLVYAAVMSVFGQSAAAVHIGLLLANLASTVMLFALGRRLWNTCVGAVAAASFSLMSLSPSLYGTAAHATQFVVPFALGGTLLLLRARDSGRPMLPLLSGLLFGMAFLAKQHALAFVAFGLFYLVYESVRERPVRIMALLKRLAAFSLGAAAPFGVTCLILLKLGVFDTFRFWTFTYAREYASELPISSAWEVFTIMAPPAAATLTVFLVLSAVGLIAVLLTRQLRSGAALLISLLVFSCIAVCPGFYFRAHYFIQILPAVSLLIGLAAYWPIHLLRRNRHRALLQAVPLLIFLAAAGCHVCGNQDVYLHSDPREACSLVYHDNPFCETVEVAGYIRSHSSATDRVAVLGSEPEILFYARRHSATGFIYTYGLMEPQRFASGMQRQMIAEIEDCKPRYIVMVGVRNSWLPRPDSDTTILSWSTAYCRANYTLIGVVDILPYGLTRCIWGDEADGCAPESPKHILVFERRPGV